MTIDVLKEECQKDALYMKTGYELFQISSKQLVIIIKILYCSEFFRNGPEIVPKL